MSKQEAWKGETDRPLGVHRPCSCGCDERAGYQGYGYLTGSDAEGNGFTLWIEDEEVFEAVRAIVNGR